MSSASLGSQIVVGTERGRQDRAYSLAAENWLGLHHPHSWLLGRGRQGIRTQLGRLLLDSGIPKPRLLVGVEAIVSGMESERPKTKAGERAVRDLRHGLRLDRDVRRAKALLGA